MKKTICLMLVLCMIIPLCACGEPAHEHTWVEATCTEPKTCSECGETEGEALGHDFAPASYWAPETCSVCGETVGDPLPAAFEKRGIASRTLNLTEYNKKPVTYLTARWKDRSKTAECTLTAEWIKPFDPNAGYSESATRCYVPEGLLVDNVTFDGGADILTNVDGYEWRCLRVILKYSKDYSSIGTWEDYYTLQQYDVKDGKSIFAQVKKDSEDGDITFGAFSIDYNNAVYDDCFLYEDRTNNKNASTVVTFVFIRVPENYDGCVLGFIDTRNQERYDGLQAAEEDDVPRGAGDVYFRLK